MNKTPEQIHAEVGTAIPSLTPALEKYRAFTVSDIAKILDEAKGGVCEWSLNENTPFLEDWKDTTCGDQFKYDECFKHCPGCGKEIKIV